MVNIWHDIAQNRIQKDAFVACVSSPAGTQSVQRLDADTGFLMLDHCLDNATRIPYNLAFIPRTCGRNKKPLECMIFSGCAVPPATLVECRTIGLLRLSLKDDTIRCIVLAVAYGDEFWSGILSMEELPAAARKSVIRFFKTDQQMLCNAVVSADFLKLDHAEAWMEAGGEQYLLQFTTKVTGRSFVFPTMGN